MNLFKRELKIGIKPFILWTIGLFVLMFAGMTKYTGFNGDVSVTEIFDAFPKIVLAVFGMVGVDITTLGGFYAIVVYYGLICIAIYGISLGSGAVNREAIDKTYEFIFTKPRSRAYILQMKLLSALVYLTLYSLLSYVFSMASIATLHIENTIQTPIALYTVAMWLVGVLFCTLAACLSAVISRSEKAILYSNSLFVLTFVVGMIFDMFEKGGVIKLFAPLKYFLPTDVLNGKLDLVYVSVCLIGSAIFYKIAISAFEKKELQG